MIETPEDVQLEFDEEIGVETEEDIAQSNISFKDISLTTTDWTVETVISQLNKGNIDIDPGFQRRNAWDKRKKSLFIESLILGIPVPHLVLAEKKDQKGRYIVIDGKQRLLSLKQFISEKPSTDSGESSQGEFEPLTLTDLKYRPKLKGQTYLSIQKNDEMMNDVNSLLNETIRCYVIKNWPNDEFLYLVFHRLNTGSTPLSPQELRKALHPGLFSKYLDEVTAEDSKLKSLLDQVMSNFRMKDLEIITRYCGFKKYLNEYEGNLKSFLDLTYERMNIECAQDTSKEDFNATILGLEHALQTTQTIFGKDAFRKCVKADVYEKRFNRAVFDIMAFYFGDEKIAQRALSKKQEIKAQFESLCLSDRKFFSALTSTTKTRDNTLYRIATWGHHLQKILGIEFEIPPKA